MRVNGSSQVAHLLAARALADEPLNMLSHVLPVFALACQLCHGSVDPMVTNNLIVRCDDRIVYLFRDSELLMKVEVLFPQG
jgi:hypothetical protein